MKKRKKWTAIAIFISCFLGISAVARATTINYEAVDIRFYTDVFGEKLICRSEYDIAGLMMLYSVKDDTVSFVSSEPVSEGLSELYFGNSFDYIENEYYYAFIVTENLGDIELYGNCDIVTDGDTAVLKTSQQEIALKKLNAMCDIDAPAFSGRSKLIENKEKIYVSDNRYIEVVKSAKIDVTDLFSDVDGVGIKRVLYKKTGSDDEFKEIYPENNRYYINDVSGDYEYDIVADDYFYRRSNAIKTSGHTDIYEPMKMNGEIGIVNEDGSEYSGITKQNVRLKFSAGYNGISNINDAIKTLRIKADGEGKVNIDNIVYDPFENTYSVNARVDNDNYYKGNIILQRNDGYELGRVNTYIEKRNVEIKFNNDNIWYIEGESKYDLGIKIDGPIQSDTVNVELLNSGFGKIILRKKDNSNYLASLICVQNEEKDFEFEIFSSKIKVSVKDVFGEEHVVESPNEFMINNDKITIQNMEYNCNWKNNDSVDAIGDVLYNKNLRLLYEVTNSKDIKIINKQLGNGKNEFDFVIEPNSIYDGDINVTLSTSLFRENEPEFSFISTNKTITLKNIKIDNAPPQIEQAKLSSTQFKNNDKLTLTLNTTETKGSGINTGSIEFNMNGNIITGDKVEWKNNNGTCTCEMTVKEKGSYAAIYGKDKTTPLYEIQNDNELITVTDIFAVDNVGNKGETYTKALTSTYFAPLSKAFQEDSFDFVSDNASPLKYAINGNTITVSFESSHPVGIRNASIARKKIELSGISSEWSFSCGINEKLNIEDNSAVDFSFTVYDEAGNEELIRTEKNVENKIKYYAPLRKSCKKVEAESSNDNKKLIKNDDFISISVDASHEVNVKELVIAGENVWVDPKSFKDRWRLNYFITGEEDISDNSILSFEFVLCDEAGNTEYYISSTDPVFDSENKITYYAPIKDGFDDFSFVSDNRESKLARNGDTLTVAFSVTHPVKISSALINDISDGIEISDAVFKNGKFLYNVKYKISSDLPDYVFSNDNEIIAFDLLLDDEAGNESCKKSEYSFDCELDQVSCVTYYAPLETSFDNLFICSDNLKSNLSKNNDIVTITFTTGHPVELHNVKVAGNDAEIISEYGNKMKWTVSYKINNNDVPDNTNIPFEVFISDEAGNGINDRNEFSFRKDNTNTESAVIYYAPIEIKKLDMRSDNEASGAYVARNGNRITVSFETTHPVNINTINVAGKKAEISSNNNDKMHWTAVYTVGDGDTVDNEKIKLYMVTGDDAGNDKVSSSENCDIIYYAPIQISDISFFSSNANNGNEYAKDGDTITVSFTSNHDVMTSGMLISGRTAYASSYFDEKKEKHTMTYQLRSGDCIDQSNITFVLRADDIAGNQPVINTDSNAANSIKYFAPIVETTSVFGNGNNKKYIKNGDTVTVAVKANHSVFFTDASILSRAASQNGNNSSELLASLFIPLNERKLIDGKVSFSYSIEDEAGNLVKNVVSSEDTVIYDNICPSVTLTPEMIGFLNKSMDYTATFSDANLDADTVSLTVNGEEMITEEDRRTIRNGANSFQKTITIDTPDKMEKTFDIIASAYDKAGNRCVGDEASRVTIDKINPIVRVNLEDIILQKGRVISTPKVFEKGIVLEDLFIIKENNVQTIDCVIDDSTGMYPWNIKTPIETDGKKIIYLQVRDYAGNASMEIVYTLLIDGMEPRITVQERVSKEMLTLLDQNKEFYSETSFNIYLADLAVGDEEPDYFKSAYLRMPDGKKVDIFDPKDQYRIKLDMLSNSGYPDGDYALIINATDVKGNETGETEFKFSFKNQNFVQKLLSSPAFCGIALGTLIMGSMFSAGYVIFKKINARIESQIPK